MKYRFGLALLTTAAALSQTVNPLRFSASELHQEGNVTHLRGHVVMKVMSAIIYAEDADFDSHEYTITVRGDCRVDLLPVRAQPDFGIDASNPHSLADPRRFSASERRQEGEIMHLHGKVSMRMPGVRIDAESADFNQTQSTLALHGDSQFVFMKALIEPDDHLGPFVQGR
jgi:hypothetical protein